MKTYLTIPSTRNSKFILRFIVLLKMLLTCVQVRHLCSLDLGGIKRSLPLEEEGHTLTEPQGVEASQHTSSATTD